MEESGIKGATDRLSTEQSRCGPRAIKRDPSDEFPKWFGSYGGLNAMSQNDHKGSYESALGDGT
jgi:hypothetical protein